LRADLPLFCSCHGHGAHRDRHSFPTRRSSDLAWDSGAMFLALVGVSVPSFIMGALLQYFLALKLGQATGVQVFSIERRYRHTYRSEEHTSELQSRFDLVCRLLLEKKKKNTKYD